MHEGSFFSTASPTPGIACLFDESHSNTCEGLPHCGFDVHSLTMTDVEHLSCALWPSACLPYEVHLNLFNLIIILKPPKEVTVPTRNFSAFQTAPNNFKVTWSLNHKLKLGKTLQD